MTTRKDDPPVQISRYVSQNVVASVGTAIVLAIGGGVFVMRDSLIKLSEAMAQQAVTNAQQASTNAQVAISLKELRDLVAGKAATDARQDAQIDSLDKRTSALESRVR